LKQKNELAMKIRKGFALRQIGGDNVIVPEGIEVIDFNKLISLNDSAMYLWKALQDREFSVEDAAKLLTDKYEVDAATAHSDADELLKQWIKAEIVIAD
jgi:hypothetical protein